jgi:transcriptional regulator with XRE-family HTH domain
MPKRNGILATLGLNVRRQREAKQFTQEKLAERAGLDPTYISGIERGLRNRGRLQETQPRQETRLRGQGTGQPFLQAGGTD